MKDLYVVVHGEYADYSILAVCSSKEKATEIVDKYNILYPSSYEEDKARIAEYEDGYCWWLERDKQIKRSHIEREQKWKLF